ncbi:MAG: YceI family protein [Ignavibacterium sp.]|nr:MAG: YceI family protein [Ignavibacterium sp.]
MKNLLIIFIVIIFSAISVFPQGFKVKAKGEQTFSFKDKYGRNQASFYSSTPVEDITGLTNDVYGNASFEVSDISTLKGKISIPVTSLRTGIELRDEHLQGPGWLNAEEYPEITFVIKSVSDAKSVADNKLEAKVKGDFSVHGITKEVVADVNLTYLDEGEQTKKRAPGDLLGVEAKFNISLSDYDVDNMVLGQKVSDDIAVTATLVGSNSK